MFSQNILSPKKLAKYDFDFLSGIACLDSISIVNQTDDLKCFDNPRLQKWLSLDSFVIFGTGGSSLGGQCIQSISQGRNVKFVSNLDPSTLEKTFSEINIKETGFLCISKSGETLETITQLSIAIEKVRNSASDYANIQAFLGSRFVIITENKYSSLTEIANEFDFLCLEHPKAIGGRFSVFSIVGMLPALMCGIDPLRIRAGGRLVLNGSLNDVKIGASFVVQNIKNNIFQHVSFIYSDKLMPFGEWLAQLYAESSGKCGTGITPITAHGAVDQHSQLQLYLDGNSDKCFTFFLEKQESDLAIKNHFIPKNFSYLQNKMLSEIFEAQYNATLATLLEKGRNLRKIEAPSITPEILGSLFMHFMLETISLCNIIDVDPFDQPAVEQGKIITKNLLGNI
jgi:glucose-6-phosphate isomerase